MNYVELIFPLKDFDDPYGSPFKDIVRDIDDAIGGHCDSGISVIAPMVREIGWEAQDRVEAKFMVDTIHNILEGSWKGLKYKVLIRK